MYFIRNACACIPIRLHRVLRDIIGAINQDWGRISAARGYSMSYTILIVEDDENIAKYIHTCLSVGNYESEICMDGQSAVELAADKRYDLILLDVMIPGLDGLFR